MAIPRVFVSSTCYDLKQIRENLKSFIKSLGYEPVLSEEGAVYYDPKLSTQDSCLKEIPSCQLLVLIIGGRFGDTYKDTGDSITNSEYREAVKLKIPIFALVDESVLSQYHVYLDNKSNERIDADNIKYSSVDSPRIFKFIEEVFGNIVNNALEPFKTFADIESYLKKQWAGMMFSLLTKQNEDKKVADTLSALTEISNKVEMVSMQILRSDTKKIKFMNELYDTVIDRDLSNIRTLFNIEFSLKGILQNKTFKDFMESMDKRLELIDRKNILSSHSVSGEKVKYEINSAYYNVINNGYLKLREYILAILSKKEISTEDYIKLLEGQGGDKDSPA